MSADEPSATEDDFWMTLYHRSY